MSIGIGSDHAGFSLKARIKEYLHTHALACQDYGCFSDESVDYPDYARSIAQKIAQGTIERGILICGSGIGMSIAANRFKGVRAALCLSTTMAELSRKHNDANILVLASRLVSSDEALQILDVWLHTSFEEGRHIRRIKKIDEI